MTVTEEGNRYLKVTPSHKVCKLASTECFWSISAGSGSATGSAPADLQTRAGISGSTEPLLHIQVGFL